MIKISFLYYPNFHCFATKNHKRLMDFRMISIEKIIPVERLFCKKINSPKSLSLVIRILFSAFALLQSILY